ncbi:plasmid mobilization relaxosome protein MobC [Elizabethkingia anophelis]|uniref:plasmid mobilization relaxosome protein MobC n=1 Tax=Elizabethkingia anophelis TaxID=1117645 RepID=UPI000423A2E0|nr:plasmid mobilization relaxosome protein MobC [Elizabethkingia anophelis]
MEKDGKEDLIIIRIQKSRKENWKRICLEKQISLTSLITHSVENRILNDERRKVMAFIEKQDNIFIKIETNINQIARIVNVQKFISEEALKDFLDKLSEIEKLKREQNMIFSKIYSMLAR